MNDGSALAWPLLDARTASVRRQASAWREQRGLLASVALHAVALAALAAWSAYEPHSAAPEKAITLILERPAPQPVKVVPPKVEQPEPQPLKRAEPARPNVPHVAPQPVRSMQPQPRTVAAPPATAQIATPPAQPAAPQPVVAAPPAPPAPSAPPAPRVISQDGIPSDYVNRVFERINSSAAEHYPRIARFKHLEGRVGYRLTLAPDGTLLRCELRSSGDDTLDTAANDAIRAAAPFPRLPELGGSSYVLQGTIVYQAD
ncbi:TonB family protein [Trinickia diaoshuihuensis]|uniref:TonB family protein n=1 Tax=Trinickia diaoshuihuensis TaxID=2292265 RepID=UPI000E2467CC|nr:TonB family protein [Trinickia diaoshuihuensis]